MRNSHPALRIFLCMKTRGNGRSSCGPKGASEILSALREELESRGLAASHIDVRPSGCLGRCEDGPVLLGFTGSIAEQAAAPNKLPRELLPEAKICFEGISVEQIPAIVDRLLGMDL